jgi:hypothetical protein
MADQVAMMQAQLEQQILNVAQTVEDQLDAQAKALDDLDDDGLEKLREKRMQQMRKANEQKAEWRRLGHGQYQELTNEKEFFEAAKASEWMLCHFYRGATKRCEIVDKHLGLLAPKHIEARCCRINAEKSPFLVEKLLVVVLPTIALVHKGKVIDYIVGFDDLGGHDDFPTEVLEWRIACQGVFKVDYDVHDGPPGDGNVKQRYGGKMVKARPGIWQKHDDDSDDLGLNSDEDD